MAKLSPYIYSADARNQAQFYADALSGQIADVRTFAMMPNARSEDKDKVMHLVLRLGEDTIFMADSPSSAAQPGNAIDLTVEFATEEEGRRAFEQLAQGGEVLMGFEKMFWGTWFGRLRDKFGIRWQVSAG